MDYKPISADSHVTEPPNCYLDYIEPAFRARAPHLAHSETHGDIFVIEGLAQPIPMGLIAAAGRDPLTIRRDGNTVRSSLRAPARTLQGAGDLERSILALGGVEPQQARGPVHFGAAALLGRG